MDTKQMSSQKVGSIVAEDYRTAAVFSEYGIDFCCSGGVTLADACEGRSDLIEEVCSKLEESQSQGNSPEYKALNQEELINHVIENHHGYVTNTIPVLKTYLEKLCRVHGERQSELFEIREEFEKASGELTAHMNKEERILFPYLVAMHRALKDGYELDPPYFGNVDNPIKMMEEEHNTEGERFRKINALSSGYMPPKGACQTYRVAYAMLKEFETDLHTHIHLENNLIFPKARKMYQSAFAKSN